VGGGRLLADGNTPGDTLGIERTLHPYDFLRSTDGRYVAIMQADGNFVIYKQGGIPVWATGTWGSINAGTRAIMQWDGNFVLYRPVDPKVPHETPIWATGTVNHPSSVIIMQNDCNLVIYEPTSSGGRPIWASNTWNC
jgi:hypothetical protein